ncbi:MAG: hypothetical protein BRD49_03240, partial [Bacteroidetes bacterium SW_10_40_5]
MKSPNQNIIPYVVFMLISPIIGLFNGLIQKKLSLHNKKWILIVFSLLFVSVIHWPSESADGKSNLTIIKENYQNVSFEVFIQDLKSILTFSGRTEYQDPYAHILAMISGSIFGIPFLAIFISGFIYAYCFWGSIIKMIQTYPKQRYSWLFIGFFVFFISLKFLHDFQTIRSWTGLWILFFGAISYYTTGNKKYLWLFFIPPFVHFMYFLIALPSWIVLYFGNRALIYSIVFTLSFFTTIINPSILLNLLRSAPLGADKVQSYLVEDELEKGKNIGYKKITRHRFYDIL